MSLIPDPVTAFVKANRWIVLALVGVVILIALLALSYCAGGAGETAKVQEGTITLQTHVIAADGNASDARVADTVQIQNQQREIEDAVQNTSSADDARRAFGCAVMRQQGHGTAAVAAGC